MLRKITPKPKTAFARKLRSSQTPGEKALWRKLRANRFHGLKFRRQVPVGPYIVDFLCVEKSLVIEIDGDSHFQPGANEKDVKRELCIKEKGFEVLRFRNAQAVESIDIVLEELRKALGLKMP